MLANINNTAKRPTSPHPLLNLGFRVFFAGSAIFSVAVMLLWVFILQGIAPFKHSISPFMWHGHEMIFGYSLAVIAGFLLTAVKTWTGQPMPYGYRLLIIFIPWVLARLLWLMSHAVLNEMVMALAGVCDLSFWALTSFAVIQAVAHAKQKRQIGIVAKLILLFISHIVFYIGVFSNQLSMQSFALYFALYLVIGVVFTIARRVLPFFITKGISVNKDGKPSGINLEQKNSTLLDRLSLVGLAGFLVFDLLIGYPIIASIFAMLCFVSNILRLKNWYHPAIWQKPLLWSLVLAFLGMTLSFLLLAIYPFIESSLNIRSLGMHGLALFGIGLMTLAMMARVSLGHTGRNIHTPPKTVSLIFTFITISAICRVFMPLLFGEYMTWILISQIFWIISFVLFCLSYLGILAKPRTDGLFG